MRAQTVFSSRRNGGLRSLKAGAPDRTTRKALKGHDWDGTLADCEEVLREDPGHLGALEVMAQAQWFAGEFDAVIKTTTKLLRINPLEPGYRYTRGMALLSRGELMKAADDFRRALEQSEIPGFRAQVSEALDAVEIWIAERGVRPVERPASAPVAGFVRNSGSAYPYH